MALRRRYQMKLEKAGIMPCVHVAIQQRAMSFQSCSFSRSGSSAGLTYEHHAIFDRENGEYIHISTTDDNAEMRVIRTGKTAFEARSSQRPRIVNQPATAQEACNILARARMRADAGEQWAYSLLSHNCEHFVNECWNPSQPAQSLQARYSAASIGGSGVIGAASGGTGGGIAAAAVTIPVLVTTSETSYILGIFPITVSSTSTVMTGLPLAAVIGIGAASTVIGGVAVGGAAYGIRELVYRHRTKNSQLVPIAIYNRSRRTITASLWYEECKLPWLWNPLYKWRELIGVGSMSSDIDGDTFEELNPPTVDDTGTKRLVLKVVWLEENGRRGELTCQVSRGDVVTFDGATLTPAELAREDFEECSICCDNPANVIMLPCGHHNVCEQCVLRLMRQDAPLCPHCREKMESYEVVLN